MTDINSRIDQLMAERRPDRFTMGEEGWMEQIALEVADDIPEAEARRVLALDMIRSRERVAVRRGNQLIREIAETGQWPLGFLERLPIAVGKEHVALPSCRATDLKMFATDERRRILADMETRNQTVKAAEKLEGWIRANGVEMLGDLKL